MDVGLTTPELDNPAWHSLIGPHARLAESRPTAARYPADVCPFVGLADSRAEGPWDDLGHLIEPEGSAAVIGLGSAPEGWDVRWQIDGFQMVGDRFQGGPDDEAVGLGVSDVPEMLDLVERTRPGPFLPRTVIMGTYLGIRREGKLMAMAGERLHPAGWTEISAVCTDSSCRGHGLATRLVGAITAGIRDRGEVPFLHVAGTNTGAIRLYETLGFHIRRATTFSVVSRRP
jgi:ribosomal protein S18 acetylase RimI-like enzyme